MSQKARFINRIQTCPKTKIKRTKLISYDHVKGQHFRLVRLYQFHNRKVGKFFWDLKRYFGGDWNPRKCPGPFAVVDHRLKKL